MTSGGTTTPVIGTATISGLLGGTANIAAYVSVSSGQGGIGSPIRPCLPASAVNTAIVVTEPAGGAGTVTSVWAWGYQL
jgi:hypothetical protein